MKRIIDSVGLLGLLALLVVGCSHRVAETAPSERDIITNSVGMKLVLIPAGTVKRSDLSGEPSASFAKGLDRITVSKPFYLQTTEVTQGQWKNVMGYNPSYHIYCGDDCPVEQVTWKEVREFIRRLNQLEGTDKYRLPSETEWQYACYTGSAIEPSSGDKISDYEKHRQDSPQSARESRPVGQGRPDAWGLHDMHGYLWEWCQQALKPSADTPGVLLGGSPSCGTRMEPSVGRSKVAGMPGSYPEIRSNRFGVRVAKGY